jgi:hypothetical protein
MIPVALGNGRGRGFQSSVGPSGNGWLIASTVLSWLVIPTVFEIFDEWLGWLFSRFGGAPHAARHDGHSVAPGGSIRDSVIAGTNRIAAMSRWTRSRFVAPRARLRHQVAPLRANAS